MKKLKYRLGKRKKSLGGNRVVLAALAGAITGLAITYLLESEKGRSILAQVGTSVKTLAANLTLPKLSA